MLCRSPPWPLPPPFCYMSISLPVPSRTGSSLLFAPLSGALGSHCSQWASGTPSTHVCPHKPRSCGSAQHQTCGVTFLSSARPSLPHLCQLSIPNTSLPAPLQMDEDLPSKPLVLSCLLPLWPAWPPPLPTSLQHEVGQALASHWSSLPVSSYSQKRLEGNPGTDHINSLPDPNSSQPWSLT